MLSYYSEDNIAQVKSLCNVVREARDNIAQEKNTIQCCLNTLETTLHKYDPYAMLPKRPDATLRRKKYCAMLS